MGIFPFGAKPFARSKSFQEKMHASEEEVKVKKVVYDGEDNVTVDGIPPREAYPTFPIYDHAAHQHAIDDTMGFRHRGAEFDTIDSTAFRKYILRTPEYKIIIPIEFFQKMVAYARASKGEISGFAKVKKTQKAGQKYVTVTDVRIFEQVVNPVHTKLLKEDLHPLMFDLISAGENPGDWPLWWHSHNDFNVFFSHEDEQTIKSLSTKRDTDLFSVCVNKDADYVGRHDFGGKLQSEDNVFIDYAVSPELLEATAKEVKEKVTFKPTAYRKKAFRYGAMRD